MTTGTTPATPSPGHFSTYYGLLRAAHQTLRPTRYLEIGVHKGHSLAFVQHGTEVVGVDPNPIIEVDLPARTTIVEATSDAFFAEADYASLREQPFDLVFVDGLHLFEQAAADILNAEAHCRPGAVILVHDCLPIDARTSQRDRDSLLWSGDVWKAILALRTNRPDLRIHTMAAEPTGVGVITGLTPTTSPPGEAAKPPWLAAAVTELLPLGFADLEAMGIEESLAVLPPDAARFAELLPASDS